MVFTGKKRDGSKNHPSDRELPLLALIIFFYTETFSLPGPDQICHAMP